MSRIDSMEATVHGRQRLNKEDEDAQTAETPTAADESRFGVQIRPMELARGKGVDGAQWTGVVTAIATSMILTGMVDAVVCIAGVSKEEGEDGDFAVPCPIIAKTVEQVMQGRGVKPALAPSLAVLDEIKADASIKKLCFCGVGCAVQAFRAVQDQLGLDEVYVLGTNCADNSPTPKAAKKFVKDGLGVDDTKVRGYEFMQDFRVHVKKEENGVIKYDKKPYFTLPGKIAKQSIASSCLACFDYTNGLADVVVGYMAAPLSSNGLMTQSLQSLTVRNVRGVSMVDAALSQGMLEVEGVARGTGEHDKISLATVFSDNIVLEMLDRPTKEEGMPLLLGNIFATVMRRVGPKGVNFAKYSIDYHVLRNYLHVLKNWGARRAHRTMPQYARDIVDDYIKNSSEFSDMVTELKE